MKIIEIEDVAICIITKMYEGFYKHGIEDIDFIPLLKKVIEGAIDCAQDNELPSEIVDRIESDLYGYCKSLYIAGYKMESDSPSNLDEDEAETNIWFDYIYENEVYPE